MADDLNEGHSEAHTRGNPAENAAKSMVSGDLAEKLQAFDAVATADDLDLFSLLEESREAGQTDTLTMMAKSVTEPRKGAGRPLGSKNLKNSQIFDLLEAQGHRRPVHVLSLIASIDPRQLAVMMRRHKHFGAALDKIIKAASELMPYDLAKRSADVEAPPLQERPVIVINQLPAQHGGLTGGAMSVSGGHIMRHDAETVAETSD
ncbi:MAG: hypothetical protein ACRCU5_13905 [Rhizobiaceae bacterium]